MCLYAPLDFSATHFDAVTSSPHLFHCATHQERSRLQHAGHPAEAQGGSNGGDTVGACGFRAVPGVLWMIWLPVDPELLVVMAWAVEVSQLQEVLQEGVVVVASANHGVGSGVLVWA